MKVNFTNKTIDLTKTEAKKASQIGTDLYNQLVEVRTNFPNFKVTVVSPNKSKRADALKGLTYGLLCCRTRKRRTA